MTKIELRNKIEDIIDALLDEMGEGSEREDVTECALLNIVYGYCDDKYSLEDVIEASKYLEIPVNLEEVEKERARKIKRKQRKAAR